MVWADNPIHGPKLVVIPLRTSGPPHTKAIIHNTKTLHKMKAIQWHPQAIFGSVIMSRRHVECGTTEDSDFGTIEVLSIPEQEKQLVVSFKDGGKQHEYVEFDGMIYARMQDVPLISRKDSEALVKLQGRMTPKMAVGIALKVRSSMVNTFHDPGKYKMLLIGRVLYKHFGKPADLVVNTCGNLSFSYWLSVDIEWNNPNKSSYPCHKSSFEAVVRD